MSYFKIDPNKRRMFTAFAASCVIALLLGGCKHQTAAVDTPAKGDEADQTPVTVETAVSYVHPMETTLTAQGTLALKQGASARVAPVVGGRLADVKVREGDPVKAGQIVAVVDNHSQKDQIRVAAAALAASQAQAQQSEISSRAAALDQASSIKQATLALQAARLDRDANVRQARIALNSAQTDLNRLHAGARPQEIMTAQQAVTQAKSTRNRANIELERVTFLFNKGVDSKRQVDDAKTALEIADSSLTSAQQQLSLLKEGARREDIQSAELKVQGAKDALTQAQTSGDAKVKQAQAALTQAQQAALQVRAKQQDARAMRATAAQRRAELAAAQTSSGYTQLHAPINGIVTRRSLNPGDIADPTVPVLEIANTRALDLIANLPAEDGMKARTGMIAHVTSSDAPGHVFVGRVLNVGQVDPQTNLLSVRIEVANPNGTLKVGSFATAEIVIRTDKNAIVVPKQAIITHDGKPSVFVVDAEQTAHQKEVATGTETDALVEITHGLKPGEKVIRLGQYALKDGAKVKSASEAAPTTKAEAP